MYESVIRYLARAFVPHVRVETNAKAFADVAAALKIQDWSPRPLQEVAGGTLVQRLSLSSPAGDWFVTFLTGSIDVQHVSIVGQPPVPFAQFCEASADYLGHALEFAGTEAHRLASIQEGTLPELQQEGFDAVFAKLCNVPPQFGLQTPPFEWDWRVAFAAERTFGQRREPTNTLAVVKRIELVMHDERRVQRLMVSTDVNTRPDNVKPRFDGVTARSFMSASAGWHDELGMGLLSFLGI